MHISQKPPNKLYLDVRFLSIVFSGDDRETCLCISFFLLHLLLAPTRFVAERDKVQRERERESVCSLLSRYARDTKFNSLPLPSSAATRVPVNGRAEIYYTVRFYRLAFSPRVTLARPRAYGFTRAIIRAHAPISISISRYRTQSDGAIKSRRGLVGRKVSIEFHSTARPVTRVD